MGEPGVNAGDEQALHGFLAERDMPCPACRYNLRGLQAAACPECGLELRLGVQLAEPATGTLVATLGGLFAGTGGAGFIVAAMIFISIYVGEWAPLEAWIVPVPALMLLAPLAIGLCTRRGRLWFRERSAPARLLLAWGSWGLSVLVCALFMLSVVLWG